MNRLLLSLPHVNANESVLIPTSSTDLVMVRCWYKCMNTCIYISKYNINSNVLTPTCSIGNQWLPVSSLSAELKSWIVMTVAWLSRAHVNLENFQQS